MSYENYQAKKRYEAWAMAGFYFSLAVGFAGFLGKDIPTLLSAFFISVIAYIPYIISMKLVGSYCKFCYCDLTAENTTPLIQEPICRNCAIRHLGAVPIRSDRK